MSLKRPVRDVIPFVVLILGNIVNATTLSGVDIAVGQILHCTNDLDELMSCDLEAQNCTEYSVNIRSDEGYGEVVCIFKQCDGGRCCCSTRMKLILYETHTATVWKGSENVGSKTVNITESFKPKVPRITSVKESNGNFDIRWNSDMLGSINDYLIAQLSYYKKGDTKKIIKSGKPTSFIIPGRELSSSTTYLVRVKTCTDLSHHCSDSSEEWEFTTTLPHDTILSTVIITLSLAPVIGGIIYCGYRQIKAKWWDIISSTPNHKLIDMHPSVPQLLKPVLPVIAAISVESLPPQEGKPWPKEPLRESIRRSSEQSGDIQTNSSCPSYATTEPADIIAGVQEALGKAFANISPISPLTTNPLRELNRGGGLFSPPSTLCGVGTDDLNCGLYDVDNKTYSSFNIPHQSVSHSPEMQTQAETLCGSSYHPSRGDTYQPVPTCPLVKLPPAASPALSMDMSYQQCNSGPGRFSYLEDSPISSDTDKLEPCDSVPRGEAGCDGSDMFAGGAGKLNVCDQGPCCMLVSADPRCFPSIDDAYKPFQNLVMQPDILFSEKISGEEEEPLNKYPEASITKMSPCSFSPVVPGFTNDAQHNHSLLELQTPFPILMTVDSSYKIM